ncbi:MAG: SURF1 family protein [Pseudomonadota bacterium]
MFLNIRKITLIVLCLLVSLLCARLAFWQIQRAQQKEQEQKTFSAKTQYIELQQNLSSQLEDFQGVKILAVGVEPYHVLLDNRTRNGQVGFELLSLVKDINSQQYLWLNRGWLPAHLHRDTLPSFTQIKKPQMIKGRLITPQSSYWLPELKTTTDWPAVAVSAKNDGITQFIENKLRIHVLPQIMYAEQLPSSVQPETVLSNEKNSFQQTVLYNTQWHFKKANPDKHWGYAFQWSALSLLILILMVWRIFFTTPGVSHAK